MNSVEKLAKELDQIDEIFQKDRTDPSWHIHVNRKDAIVDQINKLLPTLPHSFPLSRYLLSPSKGYQTVAIAWIRYKKDPSHLNVICYILLNSPSNFLTYYVLLTLMAVINQCDYEQLCQIEQSLLAYLPPPQTSRCYTKNQLLEIIKPQIEFSISDIEKDSYWWREVESQFFNSLAGTSQYRLCAVQSIRNQRLFERFHTYREQLKEDDQIFSVYHGSTPQSLQAIAKQGFLEPQALAQMAGTISTLDPGYFGRGIYQGFAADYAIHYAEYYKKSDEILLSMVLPGRSYIVKKGGEKYGEDCQSGFHSHISPESKEIVLFQSEQILPLFIIQFKRIPNAPISEEPCD